jgi:TRAP-type C4-dicarboxylate transport system permease small subunit
MMHKIRETIDRTVLVLVSALFIALVSITVLQVILRYLFNSPLSFVDEFARFALAWVALLGGAWVIGQKGHLAMDIMLQRIKNQGNALVLKTVIACLSITFFAIIMVYGGTILAVNMRFQVSPALNLSMGVAYAVLPLSGLLSMFYLICDMIIYYKEYESFKKGADKE